MKRTLALIIALVMMLSCFAACGSSGGSGDTETDTPASTPSDTGNGGTDSSAEAGILRIAFKKDMQTMDVTQTTDNYFVPMNVYDRLFEIQVNDDESTEIVSSLCEEYSVAEDAVTYSFKLREGIKFSNGAELTAEDVLYTFTRLLTVGGVNDDIPLEVLGADALQSGEAEELEGFVIVDDYNFTITLSAPNAGFIAELTSPALSIVDKGSVKAAINYGIEISELIGTGPYLITEWETNDHFVLEVNENYWGEAPSVKKCIVYIVPDSNTQNLMFQNGELDIIDLDWQDATVVTGTYQTEYADQLVSRTRVALVYFAMNSNNEYLSDVNVRKAVQMAINRQSIVDSLYNGNGTVLNGIIPKGVVGYNENGTEIKYDPDAAKALLEDAGYAQGEIYIELALDSSASANMQLALQVIQQNLQEIGINAEIKSYDESSWLALRKSGEMCTFIAQWTMDYNDPANIMYTFFGGEEKTVIRSLNYGDTNIMERVANASSIIDDAERYAEYQALEEKIVHEDAAWVPMYALDHLFCVSDSVAEYIPHWAGYNDFYLCGVTLK